MKDAKMHAPQGAASSPLNPQREPTAAPKRAHNSANRSISAPSSRRRARFLPPCHPPATFQSTARAGFCRCLFHKSCRYAFRVSIFCSWCVSPLPLAPLSFPEHVCPAAATWAADIDFLVHLHKLAIQVLHLCAVDTPLDGLTNCMPVFVHKVVVPI